MRAAHQFPGELRRVAQNMCESSWVILTSRVRRAETPDRSKR